MHKNPYIKNKNKCINDKGVSLVELIIIIAIMAVLSTGLISMISILNGRAARECAQDTLSALSKVRVLTLSKSTGAPESGKASDADVYLEIIPDSDGRILIKQAKKDEDGVVVVFDQISVGAANVDIIAVVGGSEVNLTGTDIKIAYDRATGAFLKYSDEGYMTKLTFKQGKSYTIYMTPATGKATME
ncbi:pilus assembly FimT family protein [Butyrivibrio fibrisolvens]|uniref:pilus assembly FimT family protein n=1 Tax=Butyrivibrio fibrisolvens TaxID=831 RepID=UPI00040403B3|nr:prepilin-type N-terminal cleavage/methylation domain-containing protein [Butyrivibrio fibrisolvens]